MNLPSSKTKHANIHPYNHLIIYTWSITRELVDDSLFDSYKDGIASQTAKSKKAWVAGKFLRHVVLSIAVAYSMLTSVRVRGEDE